MVGPSVADVGHTRAVRVIRAIVWRTWWQPRCLWCLWLIEGGDATASMREVVMMVSATKLIVAIKEARLS